jgi:tRNA threonylcarbamoyladenosine biosynthesis protein TsaE
MDFPAIELHTHSPAETQALAARIALALPPETVLLPLTGELGGGKTTFVQGLARALGITRTVGSPSFLLMKEYHEGARPLRHIDLYRITGAREIAPLGLLEDIAEGTVVVVEWADRVALELYAPAVALHFAAADGENSRRLTVTLRNGASLKGVADALRAD